jgi:hypothetical protein
MRIIATIAALAVLVTAAPAFAFQCYTDPYTGVVTCNDPGNPLGPTIQGTRDPYTGQTTWTDPSNPLGPTTVCGTDPYTGVLTCN